MSNGAFSPSSMLHDETNKMKSKKLPFQWNNPF